VGKIMRNGRSNDRIRILFEDNHIIVVEKPPNMLTQGDSTGDDDLLSLLKEDIRIRYNKPGNVYLGLVHRLDRPVGGAMVFAKTSKAASRLSDQIRKNELEKKYLAVAHGRPEEYSGTLVNFLAKDEKTNTVRVVESAEDGKMASLEYNVLDHAKGMSLIKIKLHTGRSHQIRVQLAATGHPLYGDQKYGGSLNKPGMQLALWSAEIGFTHPTLKQFQSYRSMPPDTYPWNLFSIDHL
jgi:23S rRNA pseudouridine1911/1915/1917 synthase